MVDAVRAQQPFEVALLDHQMPDCDGAELGRRINANPDLKSTRLVLLTSSGQRGDGQQFAQIDFAGYLLKPVSQRDLTDCLSLVLSSSAEEWHERTQPIVTRHHLRAQRGREQRRILLAEDNIVNEKVACRTLERLGYCVDAVRDGRAAVAAWETGRYDLILMDCQMPVQDGYEATREIRSRETDGEHIPILALTAHAMKDDDLKCKAAGMDDYVTKPIDRELLENCLVRWLGDGAQRQATIATLKALVLPSAPPVDMLALKVLVEGDLAFAHELIHSFIDSSSSALHEIRLALLQLDITRISRAAHALKDAGSNLHAAGVMVAAEILENAARAENRKALPALSEELCQQVAQAIDYLRTQSEIVLNSSVA
jgi:CheY-like chemotaxis protein